VEFTVFWAGPGALAALSSTPATFFWVFAVFVGVGRHMWIIWVNLGYLGEFEKMLRVSQKIDGFWRFWTIITFVWAISLTTPGTPPTATFISIYCLS